MQNDEGYAFGPFRLDSDGSLFEGPRRLHLAPKELALLRLLLSAAGRVVPKARVLHEVWPDAHVSDDSLARCVSSLRRVLGDPARAPRYIATVSRRGLRFCEPVRAFGPEGNPLARLAVQPFAIDVLPSGSVGPGERFREALSREIAVLRSRGFEPTPWPAAGSRAATLPDAMRESGLDFVLAGTLRLSSDRLRLGAELVDRHGVRVWGEVAEAPVGDESFVARRLVDDVAASLSRREWTEGPPSPPPAGRSAARHLVLQGLHALSQYTGPDVARALDLFDRALDEDPDHAPALVALAETHLERAKFGLCTGTAAASAALPALARALALDPGHAAAHGALAWLRWTHDWDAAAARESFARALASDRFHVLTQGYWAMFLLEQGDSNGALAAGLEALDRQPHSAGLKSRQAWAYACAGMLGMAVDRAREAVEAFPLHFAPLSILAILLSLQGRDAEAVEASGRASTLSGHTGLPRFRAAHAYVLARAGRTDQARTVLESMPATEGGPFVPPSLVAPVHVALGDPATALDALERAAGTRCPWLCAALVDPRLAPLRSDPRWGRIESGVRAGPAAEPAARGVS